MKIIPIKATDAQLLTTILNGVHYQLAIRQRLDLGVFMDIRDPERLVAGGRLCHDRARIVRDSRFPGDLFFMDMQGRQDPDWPGFGSRFVLCWQAEGEDYAQ